MQTLAYSFSLLDYIDFAFFGMLVVFNVLVWRKKADTCAVQIVVFVLFGVVLPFWSMGREINRNTTINGPAMDSFELLYAYLVFPAYWLLMIAEIVFLSLKRHSVFRKMNSKFEA